MRKYANLTGADFHHVTDFNGPEFNHVGKWNHNINIRFAKYAIMQYFIKKYDHVALFDDTIVFSENIDRVIDIFEKPEKAVGATLDQLSIDVKRKLDRVSVCRHYGLKNPEKCKDKNVVNSGLLVFSRKYHKKLFNVPSNKWKKLFHFNDQYLFNSQLWKYDIPVHDYNRGKNICIKNTWTREQLKEHCFLLYGSQLRIFMNMDRNAPVISSACIAHVTKGAGNKRDALWCQIEHIMKCNETNEIL